MSAREAVENLLWWSVPGSDNEESKTRAARMLDAYRDEVAHELAEKIRGKVYEFLTPRYGFGGDPKSPWVQGQMDAADLIDPEVDDD